MIPNIVKTKGLRSLSILFLLKTHVQSEHVQKVVQKASMI